MGRKISKVKEASMNDKSQVGIFFVNIDEGHKRGHNKDTVYALRSSKYSTKFKIYQETPKTPDSILQSVLEGILTSDVVFLDATIDKQESYKDRLIQFGIAFALEKQRYFFYIQDNSSREDKLRSDYVESFTVEASGYLHFTEILNGKAEVLVSQSQPKPQKPTDKSYQSFSVIGTNEYTNPDLIKAIKDFSTQKKWHASFYKPLSGINIHDELSRHVAIKPFSIFCINKFTDINTYIAIGLALGFGIPFLILIEKGEIIPPTLNGYAGVITYESNTELLADLEKYTVIFSSPESFKTWDGFTYFYLLSKTEKRLGEVNTASEIEEIENIILAVSKIGRAPIVLAHTLLGDIFRKKNQIIDPLNTAYLKQAITWYELALNNQDDNKRCIDGIEATRKLIRLIDLIKDKNYESIPELIYLIGNSINSQQYQYLKSFLLGEVKKLLEKKDYLFAIALLAAIQKYDNSEEVIKLWEDINPQRFIEAVQTYQEEEIKIKSELNTALEKNADIYKQLSNAYKEVDEAKKVKTKLDHTTDFYGKIIFVNFGVGWATYMPIKGIPYVMRNNEIINVTEGMPIIGGDTVLDEEKKEQFHWLSEYEHLLLEQYKKLDQ
jgi:hypothetical protein